MQTDKELHAPEKHPGCHMLHEIKRREIITLAVVLDLSGTEIPGIKYASVK